MSVTVIKSRCANFRDCKLVRDSGIFPGYMRNMSSYLFTNTEVSTKPEILIGVSGSVFVNSRVEISNVCV